MITAGTTASIRLKSLLIDLKRREKHEFFPSHRLVANTVVLCGYFLSELSHYEILRGKLVNDPHEKRQAWTIMIGTLVAVVITVCVVWRADLLG
ncbi:hypothetical protein R70199_08103 [Paraburkholderia domus]|nr:hypothetical protein R70199_08103 [Paraburkholderia domus]